MTFKPDAVVTVISAPANYRKLLGQLPADVKFETRATDNAQFIHVFATRKNELAKTLRTLRKNIADNGILWISWPKKASGVPTDIVEETIRDVALPLGFVDVKVCAVDDTWSGLKLMVRREHRRSTFAK